MDIVYDLAQVDFASRAYVTVGVLDGVHLGHQQLVTTMVDAAHSAHNAAVAITFDPHPAIALGCTAPLLLTTVEERADLLTILGLDVLVVLPFTPATVQTRAIDFVKAMIDHLHLAKLWGGPDLAFGYRREGNVSFLQHLGIEQGFTMHIVEPLMRDRIPVSSSRVRTVLRAGNIEQATACLGRPYRLTGTIVRGRGVGRRMEVPTANLSLPPARLIPPGGVYACLAHTKHLGTHPAVVNIGTRPTFDGQTLSIEAHLLNFDADVYGQTLSLDFIARLRDEHPFSTIEALVAQIQKDIAQAILRLGVVS
ncbi:MAG: bifunctional riboflavin kinase/FAD synthetase [Chloroflexi bacterium]|nr:bifunctional riboflavin kinase/FAD synthetase [Chloroflexota bacterium]